MVPPAGPTRILHVIAPVPAGGAESVVRGLTLASAAQGLEASVAALLQSDEPSPFVVRLRQDGTTIHEIRCGRRRYLKEVTAVQRTLASCAAEVVHTHVYHADGVGYLAARRCHVPVVATVHGFTGGDWKNRLYQWVDQRLLRRFDAVICVAEPVRQELLRSGVRPARLHLIPNAYQPVELLTRATAREQLGLEPAGAVAGWVGRLSTEKGPDLFLAAMAHRQLAGVTGVMLGDGPERPALLRQQRSLGLDERRVRLAGNRVDAAALMPGFDVMVLTSRTEGTPMALLEAMSAGVPVVAFAVGGIPQVLDTTSGWLVEPGDTTGLGRAIQEALADRTESGRRAAQAREVLRTRFGVGQWMDRIREVYLAAGAG